MRQITERSGGPTGLEPCALEFGLRADGPVDAARRVPIADVDGEVAPAPGVIVRITIPDEVFVASFSFETFSTKSCPFFFASSAPAAALFCASSFTFGP